MTRYSDWPLWLQVLVVGPHGILLGALVWVWWPKSDKDWRRFWFVAAIYSFFIWSCTSFFTFRLRKETQSWGRAEVRSWFVGFADKFPVHGRFGGLPGPSQLKR